MPIHDHISRHALEHPRSVALVFGDLKVTYAELDSAAEAFADDLFDKGIIPGDHIPVLLPRSPSFVVALLAVLKIGASYAALDPRWPDGRVRSLLKQLGCRILVSESTDSVLPIIAPPSEFSVARNRGRSPRPLVDPESTATIFFTSGTSGTPKAILSPHRATTRLFTDHALEGFSSETVTVQSAPLPWDGLSLELWGPLIAGGTVVLCIEDVLLPSALRAAVRDHGVTTLWLTSSLFNLFIDEDPGAFEGIRSLYIGGERLSSPHVRKCLQRHPGMGLYNGYGPAESCVFATVHEIALGDTDSSDGIPIGYPVNETVVHLFDEMGAPSDSGEIYLEGTGLAVGYLNDSATTESAFPFIEIGGVERRMYRTGDFAHRNDKGALVFDGRADRQIKIRGHRIELAELEAAAIAFAGVSRCVADLSDPGREAIYLYVVSSGSTSPPIQENSVRSALEGMLPSHLLPTYVIAVETLPLTTNGKIDIRRLRQLVPSTGEPLATAERLVPPDEVPLLSVVTSILSDAIEHRPVDPARAFFDQGGDSLSAVRAIARLRGVGLQFAPSQFKRTTSALDILRGANRITNHDETVTSEPEHDGAVRLTDAQAMVCLQQTIDPTDSSFACLMNWTGSGVVDVGALRTALSDVIARHQALRARYSIENGAHAVVLPSAPDLTLSMREVLSGEQARDFVISETATGFEIGEGRLVKAAIALWPPDCFTLGIGVHHIAFDGWSESIFARDLSSAYARRKADGSGTERTIGTPVRLAPSMHAIHAAHKRQVDETTLPVQRQQWIDDLADAPATTYPPPDRPLVLESGQARRSTYTFNVPASSAVAIGAIARDAGVTLLSVLLHGFLASLGRVLAIEDIVVGIPLARRGDPDLVHAVSYLVDMLPVRFRATQSRTVREVQKALDTAKSAQDVSFAQIVGLLKRSRSEPVFRTIFALQDNEAPSLILDGRQTVFTRPPANRALADVVVEIFGGGSGSLNVQLSYREDLVHRSVVENLVADYRSQLAQF